MRPFRVSESSVHYFPLSICESWNPIDTARSEIPWRIDYTPFDRHSAIIDSLVNQSFSRDFVRRQRRFPRAPIKHDRQKCIVPGCHSTCRAKHHVFPKDEVQGQLWVEAVPNPHLKVIPQRNIR